MAQAVTENPVSEEPATETADEAAPAEPIAQAWQEASEHALGVDFDGDRALEPTIDPSPKTRIGQDVSLEVASGVTLASGLGFTLYAILEMFEGGGLLPFGGLGIGLLAIGIYLRSR